MFYRETRAAGRDIERERARVYYSSEQASTSCSQRDSTLRAPSGSI
jgi:hypothetical protein